MNDVAMAALVPDHNCPLCRCAWTPQGVLPGVGFQTRNAEVAANFQAMATSIRELKAENKRLRRAHPGGLTPSAR